MHDKIMEGLFLGTILSGALTAVWAAGAALVGLICLVLAHPWVGAVLGAGVFVALLAFGALVVLDMVDLDDLV